MFRLIVMGAAKWQEVFSLSWGGGVGGVDVMARVRGNSVVSSPQDMENKIRSTLNEIYFGKTKDIVNDLR